VAVIALRRLAAGSLLPIVAISIAIAAIVAACGAASTTQPAGTSAGSASGPSAGPGGDASSAVRPSLTPPTTTDTEFGTIYDALPPSFPKLLGQKPAETGAGPTSGSFVAKMSVADARKIIEVSMIAQGWTVQVGSPLEDGTVVLEATGGNSGCKTEVRFTPVSGTVMMSVLYGAACPFS
jgi:hypothetical protein